MSFSRILFILALSPFFLSGCKSEELHLRIQESASPIAFKGFQWGADFFSRFGGSGLNYESITSTVVDSEGNIYISGFTYSDLGETAGGNSKFDLFVAKMNPKGERMWLKHIGADTATPGGTIHGYDSCAALVLDNNDGLYCAGSTESSIGEANSNHRYDLLLIKFNADTGSVVWYKQWGAVTQAPAGPTALNEWFNDMKFKDNKLYFCASSSSSFVEAGSIYDVVAGRLDLDGNVEWVKQVGNISKPVGVSNAGRDYAGAMAIDEDSIYCSGSTNSSFSEPLAGSYDLYFTKFSRDNGTLEGYRQFGATTMALLGGSGAQYESECYQLDFDADGNLVCVSQTYGNFADAGGDASNGDVIIVKMDKNLNPIWVTQLGADTVGVIGDTTGSEYPTAFVFDSNNNIIVSGSTSGSLGESVAGAGDIFIVKISPSGQLLNIRQYGTSTLYSAYDNSGWDDCSIYNMGNKLACFGSTDASVFDTNAGSGDIFAFVVEDF